MPVIARWPLVAVARRELGRIAASPLQVALMAVLPVLSACWLLAIFAQPLPRDLPVALVDLDRTSLARTVARMVDETPTIRLTGEVASLAEAEHLARTGAVVGVVVVPPRFADDVVEGRTPAVTVFYNTQWLLSASLVARDAQVAVLTAAAGARQSTALRRGVPRASVAASVAPVTTRTHLLHNPHLNYHYYLLAALFPAVLQMFAGMAMAIALGAEFKEASAEAWIAAAGGSLWRAVAGKLLVHSAWFTLLAVAMLATIFGRLGTPLTGRVSVLVAGAWLFVTAVQAVACACVAVTAGLRLATSLVAFYTGLAFPFIGVTFPTMAMPPLARAWAEGLPLTHFVRLLIDNGIRGALPGRDVHHLLILAAFIVGGLVVTSWPLQRLARGARARQAS